MTGLALIFITAEYALTLMDVIIQQLTYQSNFDNI